MSEQKRFESWAVVELMGHVRMAGKVTEEERFGSKVGRVDVPHEDGGFTTVYFGGGSVYRLTPCTEEMARAVAKGSQPEPVHLWDLRRQLKLPSPAQVSAGDREPYEDDDDEDMPY